MSLTQSANSTGADWAAIARDYAARELAVPEICAVHGISQSALYYQIKRNGWPLRRPLSPNPPEKRSSRGRRKPGRTAMVRRLLTALDQKMTAFENRTAEPASAADSERDARTLGTLVRLFDKLTALGEKRAAGRKNAASAKASANSTAGKDAHDADRLRLDLARRLEKLRGGIGG